MRRSFQKCPLHSLWNIWKHIFCRLKKKFNAKLLLSARFLLFVRYHGNYGVPQIRYWHVQNFVIANSLNISKVIHVTDCGGLI
jgi:hypothetical protein